jgi:hypothetical protein
MPGRRLVSSERRLAAVEIRQVCRWLTCRTRSGRASLSNSALWWRSAVRPISTGSCVGQGRRGSLEAGDGSCRPRVPPRWSRSSAAAPIRCSGGQVSIWTTNRTIFRSLAAVHGTSAVRLAGVAIPQTQTAMPAGYAERVAQGEKRAASTRA